MLPEEKVSALRGGLGEMLLRQNCVSELSEIFDDSNTDSTEIKMGLLVRRKTNERTEWVIEL